METKGNVCVTGGAGYIGATLVRSLLQKGYTVHATLRNLGDESKVGLLKSFPFAKERLHLFEANIYQPQEFEEAIQGCVFVFHVATIIPNFDQTHTQTQKNGTVEATVNAVKIIADACIRSGTVKRLIYTSSIITASPLKDDGSGYKMTLDETCWTPLHLDVPFPSESMKEYTAAKTKAEQEILKIGEDKTNDLEVVTLAIGGVGGGSASMTTLIYTSQITENQMLYAYMKWVQEMLGKQPIVHIEDVCRAHIFCVETPLISGRFLCASSFVSSAEIAKHYQKTYPQLKQEYLEEYGKDVKWGSRKLEEKGFAWKYSTEMLLDDCLECVKRAGIF